MQASPLLLGFSLSPATLVMIPSSTVMLRPQPTPQKPQIVLSCLRFTSVSIVVVTPITPLPSMSEIASIHPAQDLLLAVVSPHASPVVLVCDSRVPGLPESGRILSYPAYTLNLPSRRNP